MKNHVNIFQEIKDNYINDVIDFQEAKRQLFECTVDTDDVKMLNLWKLQKNHIKNKV